LLAGVGKELCDKMGIAGMDGVWNKLVTTATDQSSQTKREAIAAIFDSAFDEQNEHAALILGGFDTTL